MSLSSAPYAQNEQELPEIAFPLPGGSALRWEFPIKGKKYDQWRRTHMDPKLLKSVSEKGNSPRIACWSDHMREQLVIADFDKLEKLPAHLPSFDALFEFLVRHVAGSGVVVRTYSNKVKVIYPIRLMDYGPMDKETCLGFLKERLPSGLFNAIDTSTTAFKVLGLTPSIVTELRRALAVISIIPLSRSSCAEEDSRLVTSSIPNSNVKHKVFNVYTGSIEALKPELRKYIGRSKIRENLIRWLLYRRSLISNEGFGLSCLFLADQIEALQGKVTDALKRAQLPDNELLRVVDASFNLKKAKRYIAVGALSEEIDRLAPQFRTPEPFPAMIKDGDWEEELKRLAMSWYRAPKEFLIEVSQLPDWNLNDRPHKAVRVLNRFRQWNGLPKHVLDSNDPVWGPFVNPRRLGPVHTHR